MKNKINIAGIDKLKLIEALWAGQKPALFFSINDVLAPKFDKEHAKMILEVNKGYFGYICGRRIKTNIAGDFVDPERYDDDPDTGPGTFEKIVSNLRKHQ